MARMPHTLSPLVAHHGCDRAVAEAVLSGRSDLTPSVNDYDWLGTGIYFWVDSMDRGLNWARAMAERPGRSIQTPDVIAALIYPGLCLNLTDFGVVTELRAAYQALEQLCRRNGLPLPRNTLLRNGIVLRRNLDCAVINMMHHAREEAGFPPYDSVYGVFEEGGEMYPGSGFRQKTHVQIAVRNLDCIIGYFRVRDPAILTESDERRLSAIDEKK